jgi:hypothetical protein
MDRMGMATVLTSPLLVANGFEVRRIDDPDEPQVRTFFFGFLCCSLTRTGFLIGIGQPRLVVSKMDARVPNLTVSALNELFEDPNATLESYRVRAIQEHCAAEVVRLVRATSPGTYTQSRLNDWLHKMRTLGLTQCPHGNFCLHPLAPFE